MDKKMFEEILKGGDVRKIISDSTKIKESKKFYEEDEPEADPEGTYVSELDGEVEDLPAEEVVDPKEETVSADDVEIICPECEEGTLDCVIDAEGYGSFLCNNCGTKFEICKVEEPEEDPAEEELPVEKVEEEPEEDPAPAAESKKITARPAYRK